MVCHLLFYSTLLILDWASRSVRFERDSILSQQANDQVLPWTFGCPDFRNRFVGFIRVLLAVDNAMQEHEARCSHVDLAMNQYSAIRDPGQRGHEGLEVGFRRVVELDRNIHIRHSLLLDNRSLAANGVGDSWWR